MLTALSYGACASSTLDAMSEPSLRNGKPARLAYWLKARALSVMLHDAPHSLHPMIVRG